MTDQDVKQAEEDVAQQETSEVTEVAVSEVVALDVEEFIKESRRASLEDIKALPGMRKALAVPFVIPGTDLEVLLAPSSQTDRYKSMIGAMAIIQASDGNDEGQRVQMIEGMANSLIKSCVIEPLLDDESIAALNEFSATGVTALLVKCREICGMDTADDSQAVENFIFGNLLNMS